jgi:glycosyltransferase involved in cell wall biosynthesis
MSTVTLLYRGPYQGSRIPFVVESLERAYGSVNFVWLVPGNVTVASANTNIDSLMKSYPRTTVHTVPGSMRSAGSAILRLRGGLIDRSKPVVCLGFTSLRFGTAVARGPLVWCVSGIPEEKLLYDDSRRSHAWVSGMWRLARAGRSPDLVVTVSDPMSRLIERRMGAVATFAAPTCVDRSMFTPGDEEERRYLTYLGTGAPWQGIDLLAEIWREIARQDAGIRFRVISRDERTHVLLEAVGRKRAELRHGTRAEVGGLLHKGAAGFIIRRPHIVNEVSYPTKFAEYAASGVPVVATDLDWDLSGVIRETGCGTVLPVGVDPETAATAVLEMSPPGGERMQAACRAAAERLDRRLWVEKLAAAMPT